MAPCVLSETRLGSALPSPVSGGCVACLPALKPDCGALGIPCPCPAVGVVGISSLPGSPSSLPLRGAYPAVNPLQPVWPQPRNKRDLRSDCYDSP